MARKFRLDVEYDGTDFAGWQVQPGARTVQGELEKACRRIGAGSGRVPGAVLGHVTGAGRTDAGVHAAGQVASVALEWRHAPEKLAAALNHALPEDVAVLSVRAVPDSFDARRDAIGRAYRYLVALGKARPVLLRRRALWFRHKLSLPLLRRSAALFRGRHDFSRYCTARAGMDGSVRRLTQVRVSRRGRLLAIDFAASGFLQRMVRMIVGVLLAAGSGRLDPARIPLSLKGEGRRSPAPAAPAHGLTLLRVRYPGEERKSLAWPLPGEECNILRAGHV